MEQSRVGKRLNKANARQHFRHKARYELYRFLHKKEQSHIRRIEKHLKIYGQNDKQAQEALKKYRVLISK